MKDASHSDLTGILQRLRRFRDERDWAQFHTPKNLAEAISVESGELLEKFLWLTTMESTNLDKANVAEIEEELADIAVYLLYLCDSLDLDLLEAVARKIDLNERNYPVDRAKGTHTKYTRLK